MYNRRSSRFSPEFALLGFLYLSPSYGYNLHQRLIRQFGSVWHASQSQIYNILKRLESQGYLTTTVMDQEKLPSRQMLQLTSSGRERFEDWLRQPTNPSVHAIRVEFLTRLYFTRLCHPDQTTQMIQLQVEAVEAGKAELRKQLIKIPPTEKFNRLAIELRVDLLNSVSQWLEGCQLEFQSKHIEGVENE